MRRFAAMAAASGAGVLLACAPVLAWAEPSEDTPSPTPLTSVKPVDCDHLTAEQRKVVDEWEPGDQPLPPELASCYKAKSTTPAPSHGGESSTPTPTTTTPQPRDPQTGGDERDYHDYVAETNEGDQAARADYYRRARALASRAADPDTDETLGTDPAAPTPTPSTPEPSTTASTPAPRTPSSTIAAAPRQQSQHASDSHSGWSWGVGAGCGAMAAAALVVGVSSRR
ncbi:MAG: hypothetical protein E7A62_07605 [Actinomycetaceae bacterium]|nr:hypothetical protein [Actinomycetaceae bacterium]MDU0970841.1 hypothetical protein [Actinomycetaceae bacterium]